MRCGYFLTSNLYIHIHLVDSAPLLHLVTSAFDMFCSAWAAWVCSNIPNMAIWMAQIMPMFGQTHSESGESQAPPGLLLKPAGGQLYREFEGILLQGPDAHREAYRHVFTAAYERLARALEAQAEGLDGIQNVIDGKKHEWRIVCSSDEDLRVAFQTQQETIRKSWSC